LEVCEVCGDHSESLSTDVIAFSSVPWWEPLEQHRQTLAVG